MVTKKIARNVTEEEFITNVTLKLELFVMKIQINILERTGWNSPISSSCQEIKGFTNDFESLKKELKIKFSEVFSGGLGRCDKTKAKFKLKENLQPVFKKDRNVSLVSLKQINDELDRL